MRDIGAVQFDYPIPEIYEVNEVLLKYRQLFPDGMLQCFSLV